MAGSEQYLRIAFAGQEFLLPNSASFAIEQREGLTVNDNAADSTVAWWETRGKRLPVYHLDKEFKLTRSNDWQQVVFLNAQPQPIGLAANEVQLLTRADVRVEPFHPLGQSPTRGGQLFSSAWVEGVAVTLILEPQALATYLLTAKGGA